MIVDSELIEHCSQNCSNSFIISIRTKDCPKCPRVSETLVKENAPCVIFRKNFFAYEISFLHLKVFNETVLQKPSDKKISDKIIF